MTNLPDRLPLKVEINPELLAEVTRISEKRRPSAFEIEFGLKEDKAPSFSEMVTRALLAKAMMEKSRAAGNLWFSQPLADGAFMWFSDIDERVNVQSLLLASGESVEVELLFPAPVVATLETASVMSGKSVGELVCHSLVSFIAMDALLEEHGGPQANPHQ
jgi:hypothetical protein